MLADETDGRNGIMATVYDNTPMSVRMKWALDASKKWTAEEHVDLLIE